MIVELFADFIYTVFVFAVTFTYLTELIFLAHIMAKCGGMCLDVKISIIADLYLRRAGFCWLVEHIMGHIWPL